MRRRDERDVVVRMSIPRILILFWAKSPLYTINERAWPCTRLFTMASDAYDLILGTLGTNLVYHL